MTPESIDLRVMCISEPDLPVSDFTAEDALPLLTSELLANSRAKYLRQLFEYFLDGRIPPGQRIICGISTPCYSEDLVLARHAADVMGVGYSVLDTAKEICGAVIASAGAPFTNPDP